MDVVRMYIYVVGQLLLFVGSSWTRFVNLAAPSRMMLGKYELHHLLCKMSLHPGSSLIFVGHSSMGRDMHYTIENWTSQNGVAATFFQVHAFERSLTSLMEKTLQKNQLHIYRELFNFVVFCDGIDNCLPRITNISSQKDKECGQGTLLRHFSKWLFLNVDPPLVSEVHADLDNIAVAVAVKGKDISGRSNVKISTLLWKSNNRKWSQIGDLTNIGDIYSALIAPLFPNTAYMLNGRKLKIGVLEVIKYNQFHNGARYELIEPDDKSWGDLSETWSGLLGMVARNDVDLSGIPYGITLKRTKAFIPIRL